LGQRGPLPAVLANPSLQEFIASAGAALVPPEIMMSEAISSPDQF
jgi:hypothetical protein